MTDGVLEVPVLHKVQQKRQRGNKVSTVHIEDATRHVKMCTGKEHDGLTAYRFLRERHGEREEMRGQVEDQEGGSSSRISRSRSHSSARGWRCVHY